MRTSNIRPKEIFLVANDTDNMLVASTPLTDPATGAVNLNDGQIGIFQAYPIDGNPGIANYMTSFDTLNPPLANANAPWIQLFQGTADSANPSMTSNYYPLASRPYWASPVFKYDDNISAIYKPAVTPAHSIWQVGAVAGTGVVQAYDNTEYTLSIAYRGRMMDEFYSCEATNHFDPSFVTPDYTTLGTPNPVDHLLQNMAYLINRSSTALSINRPNFKGTEPVVALLIDDSGAAGTPIGTLTAGSQLPLLNTSVGVRNLTLTQAMVNSIQAAGIAAGLTPATASILVTDLSTAGTSTNGEADLMLIMALDRELAFDDRIPQVKTRLEVGLQRGFDSNVVTSQEVSQANEGQGQGRQLSILYRNTHGQRKYDNLSQTVPIIEYPNPFDENTEYNVLTIFSESTYSVGISTAARKPFITRVCIPTANAILSNDLIQTFHIWMINGVNGIGVATA